MEITEKRELIFLENQVITRITKNEKRLDDIQKTIQELSKNINSFLFLRKDLVNLNKYYGSQKWFNDIDFYSEKELKIKAGVLSQDGVWNTLEDLNELKDKLKETIQIIESLNK